MDLILVLLHSAFILNFKTYRLSEFCVKIVSVQTLEHSPKKKKMFSWLKIYRSVLIFY